MSLKYGKAPARVKPNDLHLLDYLAPTTFKVPMQFGHTALIQNWGMLGNDQYGDCVWAGADHEVMLWNKEAGKDVSFTDDNTLSDYAAVTGFNPATGEGDNGTDVHQALDYRRTVGTIDSAGARHPITGYMAITPGHWDMVLEAAYLFSAVGIGFQVPSYVQDQFNAGKPWHLLPGKPQIEGGHYVPIVGRDARGYLLVLTWGRVQPMTKKFFERFCDEAYAILSHDFITAGRSPENFDVATLARDLKTLS